MKFHSSLSEKADDARATFWFHRCMIVDAPPTVRQLWALAAALCERAGLAFPHDRAAASKLIEQLRREAGHPAPGLEGSTRADARPRRGRGTERLAKAIAAEVARELR